MSRSAPELRARAEQLRSRRVPFVEATVVRVERPTSAKPGDTALVLTDGSVMGFVGGECAEASVTVQALAALERQEAVLLRIIPEAPAAPTHDTTGTVTVHNPCLSGGALEIFLEPQLPPPLLVILGDAPIARAVADLAERLGYAVVGADPEPIPADTVAVVAASHGRGEAPVLTAAVRAEVPYIGLVASPRRGAAVLAGLDLSEEERSRIHTPAGLDIGARTPEEVALAILAEIVSCRPRLPTAPAPAPPSGPSPTATDPVCGMTVVAVDATLHVDRDGERYWFCGSGCRQAFVDQCR